MRTWQPFFAPFDPQSNDFSTPPPTLPYPYKADTKTSKFRPQSKFEVYLTNYLVKNKKKGTKCQKHKCTVLAAKSLVLLSKNFWPGLNLKVSELLSEGVLEGKNL